MFPATSKKSGFFTSQQQEQLTASVLSTKKNLGIQEIAKLSQKI